MPIGASTADAFRIWLEPSGQTQRGYAYADALRAALIGHGAVAARKSGRVIWSVDREFVAQLPDTSRIAVVGGYRVTELSFRALTPDICGLLYGMAERAHAYLSLPGGAVLQTPSLGPAASWTESVRVRTPAAVCAWLGPAFNAWRRTAPAAPASLGDLDRRDISISSPDGGSALDRPEPAAAGRTARQTLFY
jgi:hypothetical protein